MKIQIGAILVISIMLMSTALVGIVAPEEKVPVIIGFKDKSDAALVKAHGGEIKYQYTIINAIAAKLPPKAIEALKKNDKVKYVEEDVQVYAIESGVDSEAKKIRPPRPTPTPTPTPVQPSQGLPWGVGRIDAELAWGTSRGAGIDVAIIDTGIDKDHPDLQDNIKGGVNFVRTIWFKPADPNAWDDDNGHGTHCAGIVAAVNNSIGVIGVAPSASLYAVKVLDKTGSGYVSDVVAGIEWAKAKGIKVISMSLGTSSNVQSLYDACDAAYYTAGIVIVAAAGNEGGAISYPAAYYSVIAVTATDGNDAIASFSNHGPEAELAAPGVNIYSTYKNGGYATMSGTSMACPHVSGTAALILSKNSDLLPPEVRGILQNTADDLGEEGCDQYYGYGLVDAEESVTGTQTNP